MRFRPPGPDYRGAAGAAEAVEDPYETEYSRQFSGGGGQRPTYAVAASDTPQRHASQGRAEHGRYARTRTHPPHRPVTPPTTSWDAMSPHALLFPQVCTCLDQVSRRVRGVRCGRPKNNRMLRLSCSLALFLYVCVCARARVGRAGAAPSASAAVVSRSLSIDDVSTVPSRASLADLCHSPCSLGRLHCDRHTPLEYAPCLSLALSIPHSRLAPAHRPSFS
jgi:hypothetical protein